MQLAEFAEILPEDFKHKVGPTKAQMKYHEGFMQDVVNRIFGDEEMAASIVEYYDGISKRKAAKLQISDQKLEEGKHVPYEQLVIEIWCATYIGLQIEHMALNMKLAWPKRKGLIRWAKNLVEQHKLRTAELITKLIPEVEDQVNKELAYAYEAVA